MDENKEEEIRTFVNAEDVLDKLRENNVSTVDAVCELIDNSLDANAKNIWIDFALKDGKDSMWLLVQDDGVGVKKEELMRALRLGGTMNPKYSKRIGRFGMGLSNACASQSPKSIFASKTKEDGKIWANEIDFDYLRANKARFPDTYELREKMLPKKIRFKDSGTIVYWTICDNLDKARPQTLHAHLLDTISRVYRYFIDAGRRIYINDVDVQLFDPLCKLPSHRFANEYGIQETYGDPIVISVDYMDVSGKGQKSNVVVDLVLLDYNKCRKGTELHKKLEIGMRRQGLYLVRNNREVGNPEWFGTATQRYDWLNFVRGEIRFDSVLDHWFGIGHNKNRAYPRDVILEQLHSKVATRIKDALIEHKRRLDQYEELQQSGGSELAKKVHESSGDIVIPESKVTEVPKPVAKTPKTTEQVREEIKQKIDGSPTISPEVKEKRKEMLKSILDGKYAEGLLLLPDGPNAPIFRAEVASGKKVILLNTDHKFYEYVYEPASSNEYTHTILDLVFYVLSDVREELGEKYQPLFDEIMTRFSKRYAAMFNQKDFAEALILLNE